jgi:hypothetical protein
MTDMRPRGLTPQFPAPNPNVPTKDGSGIRGIPDRIPMTMTR